MKSIYTLILVAASGLLMAIVHKQFGFPLSAIRDALIITLLCSIYIEVSEKE